MESPVVGTCLKMCPYEEMKWREKHKLLHLFEIRRGTESDPKADPNKIVKQFSRSAAGKSEQSESDLRPSAVLLKTMNYLMNEILLMNSVPWVELYNFIDDRIQAIRQDITIQMIEDINILTIYEKGVRFYVAASYILCEEPQSKFDQHLNSKQLSICLEKVISLYQKLQSIATSEIISIYLSVNITHFENFYRSHRLYRYSFNDNLVKLSLKTCISWIEGNFIRFFNYVQKLPVILQICFFHQFGYIRRETLKTLSIAYSSSNCQFPLEKVSKWLCLSDLDTLKLCQSYKIKTDFEKIHFNRKDFDMNSAIPKSTKENLIEMSLKNTNFVMLINNKMILS